MVLSATIGALGASAPLVSADVLGVVGHPGDIEEALLLEVAGGAREQSTSFQKQN